MYTDVSVLDYQSEVTPLVDKCLKEKPLFASAMSPLPLTSKHTMSMFDLQLTTSIFDVNMVYVPQAANMLNTGYIRTKQLLLSPTVLTISMTQKRTAPIDS